MAGMMHKAGLLALLVIFSFFLGTNGFSSFYDIIHGNSRRLNVITKTSHSLYLKPTAISAKNPDNNKGAGAGGPAAWAAEEEGAAAAAGTPYERLVARYEAYTAQEDRLVREDAPGLLALLLLQALPLAALGREAGLAYFMAVATATVYLGGRRAVLPSPIDQAKPTISGKSALLAPVASSISLFGVYLLFKYTDLHPEVAYRYVATAFGALNVGLTLGAVLRALGPRALGRRAVPIPQVLEGPVPEGAPAGYRALATPADCLGAAAGAALAAFYLSPLPALTTWEANNFLAWAIAIQSLGLITPASFGTACLFLGGLFLYDVWWVYGTDVMLTVALKVDAPIKFLYPKDPTLVAQGLAGSDYPFSVLGLGDVVIPGIFCAMMRRIDEEGLGGEGPGEGARRFRYFDGAVAGYALGLAITFAVNQITKAGQPALLFLNPCIIASAFITAALNGEVDALVKHSFSATSSEKDENTQQ